MSTLHLSYDESPFSPPGESSTYDMALALELKPPGYLSDHYLVEHMHHPMNDMQHSHPMSYDLHGNFPVSPYEIQRLHDIRHPTPIRPVSPVGLYAQNPWADAQPRTFYPESSSYRPSVTEPSTFHPSPGQSIHGIVPSALEQSPPPPPPPSWAMSGSLDPSTGVYQTAPEHPRIRTAQACEKCRSRKAKCTGGKPCGRCRSRGLKCEYAAERKMRGPNKIKKKPGSTRESKSRKASLASTGSSSTTDDTGDSSSQKSNSPFTTESHQFTMRFDGPLADDQSAPSSPATSARSSLSELDDAKRHHTNSVPSSPLGVKLYDSAPTGMGLSPFDFGSHESDAELQAFRRASLPSYLLESFNNHRLGGHPAPHSIYSPPRGLDVVDAGIARPRSNPAFSRESFALYPTTSSHGGSSSGASVSAPLTPPAGLGHIPDDLTYPLDFHPSSEDFHGLEPSLQQVADEWLNPDVDITPRANSDGKEKTLDEVESELFAP